MKSQQEQAWTNIGERFCLSGVKFSDYQLIVGGIKPGSIVDLIWERANKHDNLAIRVEYKGIKIGYIPRLSEFQRRLHELRVEGFKCIGVVTAFNKTDPTWEMITVQLKQKTERNQPPMQELKEVLL